MSENQEPNIKLSEALAAVAAAQNMHAVDIATKLDELRDVIVGNEVLYPGGLPKGLVDLVNVAVISAEKLRTNTGQ